MSKKIVPFVFSNRNCPACGATRSIIFYDIYETPCVKITEADEGVYEVKCINCKRLYIIEWDRNIPWLADKDSNIDNFVKEFTDNEKRNIDNVLFADLD